VREQISADLAVGAAKSAPPVLASAAAVAQGWQLADYAVMATLIYTGVLTLTTVVKNWGMWMEWWKARAGDLRRFIAWAKS
jgi:hypothetical protein